jgi:D-3-phosphoglycerate dehydrogenase / 2-oxoglutarate reductase
MRILIADKLAALVAKRLTAGGHDVTVEPALKDAALTDRVKALCPEVLVVRSTQVTAADLEAAPALALVIRAGAGVNTIDLEAASARGVYVANCPGKNASAVAELTIGHLINLDRRIADNVIALREGRWEKKAFGQARGLDGRRLAVIGLGGIGRAVVRRAQALGMSVTAWSRSLTEEAAAFLGIDRAISPEAAVADADAVSVHLALSAETRGLIGKPVFDAMRPGAYFVNTARGEIVDQEALVAAVREKGIRAGLDVFADEPAGGQGSFEDAIAQETGVYGTHHIGASTEQAEEAVGEEVVRIIDAYAGGEAIPNCVNLADRTPATHLIVVRHADRVGVLASVLGVLREAELNVQEMQNVVFSGAEAACARIAVVGAPSEETVARIAGDDAVYAVQIARVD